MTRNWWHVRRSKTNIFDKALVQKQLQQASFYRAILVYWSGSKEKWLKAKVSNLRSGCLEYYIMDIVFKALSNIYEAALRENR